MQSNSISATAQIVETLSAATDIRIIRFQVMRGKVDTSPGSHVTFAITTEHGKTTRSYSVINDGLAPDLISIAVKREENGRGGSKFMWTLEPGQEIEIVGAGNSIPTSFDRKNYLLIAGGVGVTPMTAIANALHRSGKSVKMVYCCRSASQAAFGDHLGELLAGNLSMYFDDEGHQLDIAALVSSLEDDTLVYVCGPIGLMNAVKSVWADQERPVTDLRYETFANSGAEPTQSFDVTVEETGRTVHVASDQTLLDALIESGHDVMFECLKGECGLCKLKVVEADQQIDHRDVFLSEKEKGIGRSVCACVSRLPGGHARICIDGISHGPMP